ncbi:hypothetical protein F2P56_007046 [Juglans regia]|uniref:Uncharacterized protein n=1 Tax=Juglans regia TaxID=51240 RepID=A0A833XQU6_JUGRE|nr:hypothetical protein F2P56_007046 [Juglans regia]
MTLKKYVQFMTPSCPSFPCAMDTGGSTLIIKHAYVPLTRLLKSLNELFNQRHILLAFGLTTVASVCQLLRIHLIFVDCFKEAFPLLEKITCAMLYGTNTSNLSFLNNNGAP